MAILSAQDLKKTYRSGVTGQEVRALDGAGIAVERGEVFAVLGPNGAGKTTLLNCLSLLLQPDSGSIQLFGRDVGSLGARERGRINMSSGNSNFAWCMTVRELLRFYGLLYGLSGQRLRARIEQLVEILSLERHQNSRFDELSTGTKQRLALAKALINDPEILFLDEPTIGLDPDVSIRLRSFIQEINRERNITVILTTHYMGEAEQLSHRVAFLQRGKILALGTPAELKRSMSAENMEEVFLQLSRSGLGP